MTKSLARWHKLGRFVTGLVVVCFFLPFFGVSCQGVDVITVSGADMVGGCKPGGMIAASSEQEPRSGHGRLDAKIDNVDREPLAIVALAIAVIAAAFAWVRTRGALKASFVLALAGLGVIGALYVHVSSKLNDEVKAETSKNSGNAMRDDIAKDVDAGARFGLWLVALGLGATALLTGLALREHETPT